MVEPELEVSTRAYCKMIMHSAKYPSSAINGLLLSTRDGAKAGSSTIHYIDCIPLFHMGHGLAPMVEVALAQVESQCAESGLVISGLYHAHDNLRDNHVDVFTQRIADKIAEHQPASLLVTIDCKKLSANLETPCLLAQQHIDGKWRSRDKASVRLEHDDVTLACASALVHKKIYRDLVDFDTHLDDLSMDYLNVELNMEIDSCL
jgi:hypothetical protein